MGTDITDCDKSGIEHQPAEDVYRTQVDPDGSLALATVELVSTVVDRDAMDLPPIHNRVDTDALEALFRPTPGSPRRTRGFVEFSYVGCQVRIHADGEVVVRPDRPA